MNQYCISQAVSKTQIRENLNGLATGAFEKVEKCFSSICDRIIQSNLEVKKWNKIYDKKQKKHGVKMALK